MALRVVRLGIVLAVLVPATVVRAFSDGGASSGEAFQAALALAGRDDARAAADLEALAARDPDGEFAADALLEAAQLAEEKLGRPDHAAALYGRIVERYPASRLSLRARARRDFLVANLRGGAAPLAEYQDILLRYAERPPEESRARMAQLVAAHPEFPLANDGRMWLARGDLEAGRFAEAAARFEEIERAAAGSSREVAGQARKGRADATLAAGRPLAARALYRSLLDGAAGRGIAEAALAGEAAANRALVHLALFVLALAWLGAFATGAAWQARGALVRPPLELLYYLPVAALIVLGATRGARAPLVATAGVAVGGAIVIWLGGGATAGRLARGPIGRSERALRALGTAAAIAAVAWVSIHATHLTDVVIETVRQGPER